MKNNIHPTAIIDEGAQIGMGTSIWHWVHVCGNNTSIGKECNLGQNVYVGNDVKIGNGCKIQNNVSVYDAVTLEDNVFCGPSMVFTKADNVRYQIATQVDKQLLLRNPRFGQVSNSNPDK